MLSIVQESQSIVEIGVNGTLSAPDCRFAANREDGL